MAGAVLAVVGVDDGVVFFKFSGLFVVGVNEAGGDVFVVEVLVVEKLEGFFDGGEGVFGLAHEGLISGFDAFPVVVAVHGVGAAVEGGDLAVRDLFEEVVDLAEVEVGVFGAGIAAVEDEVEAKFADVVLVGQFDESEVVVQVSVDAGGGDHANKMEGGLVLVDVVDGVHEGFVGEEGAVVDANVDAGEALGDDAAGADGHVADL